MSRKWIGGLVAVAAIGATALAASSVLGPAAAPYQRPAYATVHVDLSKQAPAAARPSTDARARRSRRSPRSCTCRARARYRSTRPTHPPA